MGDQAARLPLLQPREKGDEPSVSSALERVLDASERVIVDRIELMRLDTHETVSRALSAAIMLALGAALLFSGWFAAMAIVVLVLDAYGAPAAGCAIVAGLSLVVGGSLIARGTRPLPTASRAMNGPHHG